MNAANRILLKRTDTLTSADHNRDSSGMRYVYPVVSRRAGGVSIGINLNPNNACNWHCMYCQVPELVRGGPPPISLDVLGEELDRFLTSAIHGDFLTSRVAEGSRRLVDIAFSGNGEPTSAAEFPGAVALVNQAIDRFDLRDSMIVRLITNGSLLDRPRVLTAVEKLGASPGEVWFKLDSVAPSELALLNGTKTSLDIVARRLDLCSKVAPTWVQTCVFSVDGKFSMDKGWHAYLDLLGSMKGSLRGVHLYGLARPSLQKEASRLGRLDTVHIEQLATQIRMRGLTVNVSP